MHLYRLRGIYTNDVFSEGIEGGGGKYQKRIRPQA